MGRFLFMGKRRPALFGLNHILATGQSLSLGGLSTPELTTTQPFENKMFNGGVNAGVNGDPPQYTPLIDLVEGVEPEAETPWSAMANLVTDLAANVSVTHDALVSLHGASGTTYLGIKQGNTNYTRGMTQVTQGKARTEALDKTHGVTAVCVVHGETDAENWNGAFSGPNDHYESDMVEFQADYQADVQAITGQTGTLPMFLSQLSTYPSSPIPLAQLAAHVNNPGKIFLVGPKYHLPYADGLHLTNHGSRQLGEEFARAYYHTVVLGRRWEPLRPLSVEGSGNQIDVRFHVPTPPLVFDTDLVSSQTNYGFVYTPGGAETQTISDVDIVAADTVRITLSGSPTIWGTLKYAYSLSPPAGNLRDSDATESRHGYDLFNWCVIFSEAVAS
jgi:hypothetical protein